MLYRLKEKQQDLQIGQKGEDNLNECNPNNEDLKFKQLMIYIVKNWNINKSIWLNII